MRKINGIDFEEKRVSKPFSGTYVGGKDKKYNNAHEVKFVRNAAAVNPTWATLRNVLLKNRTFMESVRNENEWIEGEFICQDFTLDVYNALNRRGVRCGDVVAAYNDMSSHSMIAVNTTDHGLVFIDATNGLVLSKQTLFTQGTQYKRDFIDIGYLVGTSKYPAYIRGYFKEHHGLDYIGINW